MGENSGSGEITGLGISDGDFAGCSLRLRKESGRVGQTFRVVEDSFRLGAAAGVKEDKE